MARLELSAAAWMPGGEGNFGAGITVSVTDSEGIPVKGLKTGDFTVHLTNAPGAAELKELFAAQMVAAGIYRLTVLLETPWEELQPGGYVFAISVRRQRLTYQPDDEPGDLDVGVVMDRGITVATFDMPVWPHQMS